MMEVYFLLIVSRVIEPCLPSDSAVSNIFPSLTFSVVERQTNSINLEVIDTLVVLCPIGIVPAALTILREMLFFPKRIDGVLKQVNLLRVLII